jgi:hypothetical protein
MALKGVRLESGLTAPNDEVALGARHDSAGLITFRFAPSAGVDSNSNTPLTNVSVTIKSSQGRIYEIEFYNPNTSAVYIHLFDTTGTVTAGTTEGFRTHMIPAGSATNPGVLSIRWIFGVVFGSGLKVLCTTSPDHTVATAPATAISGVIGYK